jgi:multidrug efflux pump subunit AcrA (membrane-fusion protein)
MVPLGVLLLIVIAWLTIGRSGGERAGGASRSTVPTVEVQRRTLAEQVTVDGTIGYAGSSTVVSRLSGTITGLPRIGDVIRRGQVLFTVDDKPVILMYGDLPAYRRLAEGVSGQDVRQLELNLSALGYDPGTVDGEYTSSTAAAVSSWQDDVGLTETGAVELGRVVFLPSARRVTEISATLGSDGGSSPSGVADDQDSTSSSKATLVAYRTNVQAMETDGDFAPNDGDATEDDGNSPAAQGESPSSGRNPKQPAGSGSGNSGDDGGGGGGSGGDQQSPTAETPTDDQTDGTRTPAASGDGDGGSAASTPVLETSSTRRIVSAELDADQQSLVSRGSKVSVTLPGGRQAPGKVSRVEAVSASSDESDPTGGSSEPRFKATIGLIGRGRIPALDGAAVSVTLTDEVREDVLSVPLTSLVSIGGNRFAVIAREGGRRRQIVVTPGLSAEGYVEVEGKGLREGMEVEAPR